MKSVITNVQIRVVLMIVWGLFALVLTTQSDHVPLVHLFTSTVGSSELGAFIGHAALFGMLTLVVYLVTSLRLRRLAALLLTMLVLGLLGPLTELSQWGKFGRTPSMTDLLADWLGICIIGIVLTFPTLLSRHRVRQ